MEKKKRNPKLILAAVFLLVVAVVSYYGYQSYFYVKTEDAVVTGEIYKIAPKVAGKLTHVTVDVGSQVQKDEIVAEQEQVNAASPTQVDSLMVRSPIDGVILQRAAKEGEVIGAGNTLALVVDKRKLYVEAHVEEAEAGYIQVGQPVDIVLDKYPGQTFRGTVNRIGEATQSTFSLLPPVNASGNFTKVTQRIAVKITFDEGPYDFQPGLNANVSIHVR
ncbi:HlyD family secretion protein [Brevibacillus parabrevis]|uniref:HlyD family secretion protein n=1 Tax=Brevibacillus parabrevis TaxID=54914 RepID=UPI001137D303|nr:HlyD family efflux transporter periplasmic adaptor subunit [Brevibacillus parabrevis]MED1723214.1 HlyD family efflux transporter periplasmic adaptor subunit [Brevibacillus parabrevis]TGV30723.1 HlyD family efflux transporter periplasmic adaptor subunit [Mesorhizobium sp. M00.F.Ca.ET.186.01.1.1]